MCRMQDSICAKKADPKGSCTTCIEVVVAASCVRAAAHTHYACTWCVTPLTLCLCCHATAGETRRCSCKAPPCVSCCPHGQQQAGVIHGCCTQQRHQQLTGHPRQQWLQAKVSTAWKMQAHVRCIAAGLQFTVQQALQILPAELGLHNFALELGQVRAALLC